MKCPVCNSESVRYDYERGQYICSNCGFVIEEGLVDQGPEWRAYDYEDKLEKERTGSPLTLKVHDQGLTTKIGYGRVKDRVKLLKMQRLQNKLRVSSKDKKLVTYLSVLNNEASKLGLPEFVKETAALILRKLVETGLARRIDMYTLVAAVLYYSCQINNIPRHLQEIRNRYGLNSSELWKALQRVQEVSKKVQNFRPKVKPVVYIPEILDKLGLPQQVAIKSAEIVDIMYKTGLTSGKGYLALSAASVYLISTLLDVKKTQKEVAEALGITEVTIRNRYKEIINNFDIEVSL
ncbi:MAG: Zinc finger TFIIB-type domain-containing protein [Candidatus Aramenus sulfurataquae]|jgi:transcription initiation factor TFIIB|uniref:Transcription initiation factor IIB 2 n=2 Tax=Candidatus Aramenus sulfurataquae TaxID=1326980 RepID=W7KIC9_9CREN|nr:MAG: Zinc finger TFIIB-type domain-containing protein [Candidatus Aramenus sulfurataquae]MCL7344075.1 transcription initiation factor IIB family protein [Candidatus Aramenus sulfurataquae]